MEVLKYKIIASEKQYKTYCDTLHYLVFLEKKTKEIKDEIALLTLLIEKYDEQNRQWEILNPVELLRALMDEHKMKPKDLVIALELSKGYVSDILNYKKGFSKEVIRKLADTFKLSQEAFNRPYPLKSESNRGRRNAKMMNTKKNMQLA